MMHGHGREVEELPGLVRTPARPAPPRGAAHRPRHRPRRRQRVLRRPRPEDPGRRDQHHLQRRHRPADPGRGDPGAGGRRAAGERSEPARRHAREHDRDARSGRRLRSAGAHPRAPRGRVPPQLDLLVGTGLDHGRCHPADRLPPAPRRRREARPAAAPLLRLAPARRPAEPGHERHRQHRPDAPAEPDPAHHVAPDGHRRAHPDVHDQPDPRRHLDPHRPAVDRGHGPDREPLAEAVRRPVGHDRHPQRPRRGDAHGPRHREGLRPPGGGDRTLRRGERQALRGELPRPVHLGHHPARAELHRAT